MWRKQQLNLRMTLERSAHLDHFSCLYCHKRNNKLAYSLDIKDTILNSFKNLSLQNAHQL